MHYGCLFLIRPNIHIKKGKGSKRVVPFPKRFKEDLKFHVNDMKEKEAPYLFESSWKKPYFDRGIRKIMSVYSKRLL